MFSNWWMFNTFVESQLLYELSNYKSAQQDADDRDEELDPEESLGKTNSVLKILMQNVGQECGIPSVIINHRLWDERGTLFRNKYLPRDKYPFRLPFCFAFFIQPHSPLIQTAPVSWVRTPNKHIYYTTLDSQLKLTEKQRETWRER